MASRLQQLDDQLASSGRQVCAQRDSFLHRGASERDGDAVAFLIESERGIDVRKPLFYALAERSYPLLGLEALGASLEDVFLSIIAKEGD